ncbi:MAG: protein DpdE, partial [Methylococcaceae bacterium]|nr:protein DpdE [Methylococcaceae bacterium]
MFCIVKGLEQLGLGKLVDQRGDECHVEYFYSPDETKRDVRVVSLNQIRQCRLGANTRIYYRDDITGYWSVGRVRDDIGDGVLVRFADKNDGSCDYSDIFVRCKRPIDDPVIYLAQGITETPQYAEARSHFLKSYISQRGAGWGISALLSSVIELEPHQISVVRRILNDPFQRYLLADEVGLGKTIEAGVIIRQAVLDDPRHHRIVVMVPKPLVHQWREELVRRFGLKDFLDNSVHVIKQDESLKEIDTLLERATMLVVDEAHHVATETNEHFMRIYDCIKNRATSIDRILLLSATPVLRNEAGFLRMLHLLDPVMYPLDDVERFRDKIRHRQVLAESVAMLDPQNALFLDGVLDELQLKLPGDERLHELISQLRPILQGIPDENDPDLTESICLLRAHISETYRLHRRILRNRRKRVKFVTPDRAGGTPIYIREAQLTNLELLIDAWRIDANVTSTGEQDALAQFHWRLLDALLTQPGRLPNLCAERLAKIEGSPVDSFPGETTRLKELASAVDFDTWIAARLDQLTLLIPQYLTGRTKLVIFCSDPDAADAVYDLLASLFPSTVVRHALSNDEDGLETSPAIRFTNQDSIRFIICDQTSEEGLNLQGGIKLIVHFDLPLEPNRIEQRIGRVDRYGSGDPVKSIVLIDEGSKYQKQYYALNSSALGVFDRSISSLQYLVESEMQSLIKLMFEEGIEALIALANRLGGPEGAVATELKLIDQQDALDELMPLSEFELGDIFDIDEDWTEIRRAASYWANETLLFDELSEARNPNALSADLPFRFRYQVPGHGGPATLIPLSGFLSEFIGALDYEHPLSSSRQPMSYAHCARRQTAVRNGYRLIRYGDEFIEALKSFSDVDDRGRSYALWRHMRNDYSDPEPKFYFSFAFLVETNLSEAKAALELFQMCTDTARAAVRRRGDALFRPFVDHIWVDENGFEPSADF